jgi:hypothetical protein
MIRYWVQGLQGESEGDEIKTSIAYQKLYSDVYKGAYTCKSRDPEIFEIQVQALASVKAQQKICDERPWFFVKSFLRITGNRKYDLYREQEIEKLRKREYFGCDIDDFDITTL